MNDNAHLPYTRDALILTTLGVTAAWLIKLGNHLRRGTK